MLLAIRPANRAIIAAVVRIVVIADFLFTVTTVANQARCAFRVGHGFLAQGNWIAASILLYLGAGAFWLPVVWMQICMCDRAREAANSDTRLADRYHRLFRLWFAFGFPALSAVLAIFWLMMAKPQLW